ncbi:MAG: type II toxin-antitoxin system PemK/MazF family toxin [Candidatus Hydrogenedentes bacterium]|nr:type II toxin-antitoxin system PemK/MazF family toxin [Candidatus Hydrogenedentota bacterium]
MVVRRAEIWWADLPEPRGSEPGYRRPVLIVQCNVLNSSRIATVLVAAITSNLRLANLPGNVRVSRKDSGLAHESVVNVSQLYTLDRDYLIDRIETLSPKTMEIIDNGLRFVLGLQTPRREWAGGESR